MIHNLKQYDPFGLHPSDDPEYIDSIDVGKFNLNGNTFWIKLYGGESIVPHFHVICPEINKEYCFELYNARYYNHDGLANDRLTQDELLILNEAMHSLNYAASEHNGSSNLNVWEECNRWYFGLEDHYGNTNPDDLKPANLIQPDYSKIEN